MGTNRPQHIVIATTKDGEEITYQSTNDAARILGGVPNTITSAINKHHTAYGMRWRYDTGDTAYRERKATRRPPPRIKAQCSPTTDSLELTERKARYLSSLVGEYREECYQRIIELYSEKRMGAYMAFAMWYTHQTRIFLTTDQIFQARDTMIRMDAEYKQDI